MLPAGHSGAPGLNAATLYTVIRAACTSRCIFAGEIWMAIPFLDAKKEKAWSIWQGGAEQGHASSTPSFWRCSLQLRSRGRCAVSQMGLATTRCQRLCRQSQIRSATAITFAPAVFAAVSAMATRLICSKSVRFGATASGAASACVSNVMGRCQRPPVGLRTAKGKCPRSTS